MHRKNALTFLKVNSECFRVSAGIAHNGKCKISGANTHRCRLNEQKIKQKGWKIKQKYGKMLLDTKDFTK
mgnify:CR=1 FL=1